MISIPTLPEGIREACIRLSITSIKIEIDGTNTVVYYKRFFRDVTTGSVLSELVNIWMESDEFKIILGSKKFVFYDIVNKKACVEVELETVPNSQMSPEFLQCFNNICENFPSSQDENDEDEDEDDEDDEDDDYEDDDDDDEDDEDDDYDWNDDEDDEDEDDDDEEDDEEDDDVLKGISTDTLRILNDMDGFFKKP